MSRLEELIAALERATGPSPELDAKIGATLFAGEGAYAAKSPFNGEWCVYKGVDRNGREKLYENRSVPHALWIGAYTVSIDVAVALVERVMPGWFWRGGNVPVGKYERGAYQHGWGHISRTDASNCDRNDEFTGWASTPAIALCIAALKAKLSQEEA